MESRKKEKVTVRQGNLVEWDIFGRLGETKNINYYG